MKTVLLLIIVSISAFAQYSYTNENNNELIRQIIKDQEEGWNNGDAEQYSRSFQTEGIYTIITGATYHSRDDLEERVNFILKGFFAKSILTQKIVSIIYVAENIAIIEIETEMTNYKGLPPGVKASSDDKLRTSMLQVVIKTDETWKVAAFHNVDVKVQ